MTSLWTPSRKSLAAFALSIAATTGCAVADREPASLDGRSSLHLSVPPIDAHGSSLGAELDPDGVSQTAPGDPRSRWSGLWAGWNALRGDAYALDEIERYGDGSKLECDREELVSYAGSTLRYHGPVLVREPFRVRLQRFEEVAAAAAAEVYGRPPRRVRHFGAFSCRSSRNRAYRLSEHALGNAIDVSGFDFGPLPNGAALDPALPKQLRISFQVRVARHWDKSDTPVNQVHARFLRKLTSSLLERRDVFRGLIGPADPHHADHFHFDVAPWRYERL